MTRKITDTNRPHRGDYMAEPEWLVACLEYLDRLHPTRLARMREWRLLCLESDPARIRARLVELIEIDGALTRDELREYVSLADAWKRSRRIAHPITTKKEN